MVLSRRSLLGGAAVLGATAAVGPTAAPALAAAPARRNLAAHRPRPVDVGRTVTRWARDTWRSLVAMTDETTGLAADNVDGDLAASTRSGYTSPTNIGGYLWSTVVARDLGLIGRAESSRRIRQTLRTLARLDRHRPSGMFFNWYDEHTGAVLHTWPVDGSPVYPFLSSVDNGWLAAALTVVANADPANARLARSLSSAMRFDAYYDPAPRPGLAAGLLRGGFWLSPPPNQPSVPGNYLGVGPGVYYTTNHYDTTVSETRIASYLAIAWGQVPPAHYFATWRTFPSSCDWDWQEQQPIGTTRRYLGVGVFEGAYPYRGMLIVPGWGGSMFEALMPDMFVPEERWAPRSWGINHPLTVRAHREHGLVEARYGYWGFSPASKPGGGYDVYGVDAIGLNPDGYYSDLQGTNYDVGFGTCRAGTNPHPTYGDGVVTPHASFLAMHHEPVEALANLVKIERDLGAYGPGGFYDSVATRSHLIAKRYLSLDQAMVLGSIGNVFGGGIVRRNFAVGNVRRRIRPLLGLERFGAGIVR